MANTPNANGVWRTIRGARVFIEDGVITKGPKKLRGKTAAWSEETSGDNEVEFKRATYGRLYSKFEVNGRQFGVLFTPDYKKENYEVVFGEGSVERGALQYHLTGRGDAHKVMSNVGKHVSTFMDELQPTSLVFTADKDEKSRVDFYKFLAQRTHKIYPNYVGLEAYRPGEHIYALVHRDSLKQQYNLKEIVKGKVVQYEDPTFDDKELDFEIISNEEQFNLDSSEPLEAEPAMLTAEQLAPKTVRFE